eukprot:13326489-Alexandrium_andersonii.AAC.1
MGDCRFRALVAMLLKRQGGGAGAGRSGCATCRRSLWAGVISVLGSNWLRMSCEANSRARQHCP